MYVYVCYILIYIVISCIIHGITVHHCDTLCNWTRNELNVGRRHLFLGQIALVMKHALDLATRKQISESCHAAAYQTRTR